MPSSNKLTNYSFRTERFSSSTNPVILNETQTRNDLSIGENVLGLIFSGLISFGFYELLMTSLHFTSLLAGDLIIASGVATLVFASMFIYFACSTLSAFYNKFFHPVDSNVSTFPRTISV